MQMINFIGLRSGRKWPARKTTLLAGELVLVLLLSAAFGAGRDIYVSADGANNPPYTNWPDAATNLQAAVNVGMHGDTVWISNGTYVLTNQITVNSNIAISGFTNNGPVIIDGNNAVRCFWFKPTTTTGALANLFITRGTDGGYGGGAYMERSGVVRDCIFSNNNSGFQGGALCIAAGAGNNVGSIVQRCAFIGNQAQLGGGLWIGYSVSGLVDHCLFQTNTVINDSNGRGGGMEAYYCTNLVITGGDFICNVATNYGGGASFYKGSNNLATHCTLSSNSAVRTALGYGGGLYMNGDGWILSDSLVSNNIAYGLGGGIYGISGPTVKNCIIARNVSTSGGGGGIGMYAFVVQDCVIEDNSTLNYGGGVDIKTGGGALRNCLIRNNVASSGIARGGWVLLESSPGIVSSCTIASNFSGGNAGGLWNTLGAGETGIIENCIIYFNGAPANSNIYNTSTQSSYSNNCFAPALGPAYTNYSANNITFDPQFVERASGNYRLTKASPCVNTGVNRDWMNGALDLDGHRRLDGFSGQIDMGCYEYLFKGTMYVVK